MGKGGTITLFRERWNAILFGNGDDINAFCWYGNIIWNYRPFKYYTTVVELFIHAQVAWELPCLLDKLWLNGMKLGQNYHFVDFASVLAISANTGWWHVKKPTLPGIQQMKVARCKTSEQWTKTQSLQTPSYLTGFYIVSRKCHNLLYDV